MLTLTKTLPKIISREEAARLLQAPDAKRTPTGLRNRVAMQLMYRCGLRVSEVCSLSPDDIRLSEGLVYVQGGKGDKDRVVPMDPDTAEWCSRWMTKRPASPWFVCTLQGGQVNDRYLRAMMERESEKAGVLINEGGQRKAVHPHVLRHTYATELLEEGYTIVEVQQLLGHSSVAITQVYTHVRPNELAAKIRTRRAVGA